MAAVHCQRVEDKGNLSFQIQKNSIFNSSCKVQFTQRFVVIRSLNDISRVIFPKYSISRALKFLEDSHWVNSYSLTVTKLLTNPSTVLRRWERDAKSDELAGIRSKRREVFYPTQTWGLFALVINKHRASIWSYK